MGADLIEYLTGYFARAVYIKGDTSWNKLAYNGTVTTYTDTTHFASTDLTGFGDDYFGGPNNGWFVYVVRDAGGAGAVPQGEMKACTAYTSSTGAFTHYAFSAPLAADDEVILIHELVAETKDILREIISQAISANAGSGSETSVIPLLAVAGLQRVLRHLRLGLPADPGAESVTVKLYEEINSAKTNVDSFTLDTSNYGEYHSLMDMFGVQEIAGDVIDITVQSSAGTIAVTGQFSYATVMWFPP